MFSKENKFIFCSIRFSLLTLSLSVIVRCLKAKSNRHASISFFLSSLFLFFLGIFVIRCYYHTIEYLTLPSCRIFFRSQMLQPFTHLFLLTTHRHWSSEADVTQHSCSSTASMASPRKRRETSHFFNHHMSPNGISRKKERIEAEKHTTSSTHSFTHWVTTHFLTHIL